MNLILVLLVGGLGAGGYGAWRYWQRGVKLGSCPVSHGERKEMVDVGRQRSMK